MLKRLLVYVLLLMAFVLKAQVNLVPNPSFEDYTICPTSAGQIALATNWYSPTLATPDYFNTCSTSTVSVPANNFGLQSPFFGDGYIGLGVFYDTDTYIEYIGCELLLPLEANNIYCINIQVSLAEISEYTTTNLGIYFSENYQYYNTPNSINELPNINLYKNIDDTISWVQLNGYYIASGGEQYIIIGNFYPNNFNPTKIVNKNSNVSYIFLDNVSITECNIPDIEAIVKPDVFTPNNDGVNETFEIQFLPSNSQLTIYNRWGNQVYTSTNYQNNWDGANCAGGVYYYILTLSSGNTIKGTITILRE